MRDHADVETGALLIADPGMPDPNFRRTVVLVLHHGEDGTLGVVLNRPSEVPVASVLPGWADHIAAPDAVFVGGPVERDTPLCVAALNTGETVESVPGTISVRGPVALVVLDTDPEPLLPRLRGFRVFTGYAGWGAGQLADEMSRGDWMVAPALPADVLTEPGSDHWGGVLRRQGMPMALLATHPGDLQRN